MRFIKRLLIFWAISGPLFYVFGLPYLITKLEAKARVEAYTQCIDSITKQGIIGTPTASLTQQTGESYCHCIGDKLNFTKQDLYDTIQKKPPAALTAQAEALATSCSTILQQAMDAAPAATAQPAAAPTTKPINTDPNVITF